MPTSRTERLQALYLQMCRIRCTEEALGRLWHRGLVSGEMPASTSSRCGRCSRGFPA